MESQVKMFVQIRITLRRSCAAIHLSCLGTTLIPAGTFVGRREPNPHDLGGEPVIVCMETGAAVAERRLRAAASSFEEIE